jgi:tetratricopeptide (TPR) repeat protein
MKKVLVTLVLMLAVVAAAQQPAGGGVGSPQQPAGQPAAGQQPAQQKKEIKDPAEYNSYVGAIQAPDLNQKIAGLEDFLTRYPNTVVKEDALEQLMGAYQQSGNGPKTIDAANRLLQVNPNNLAGLVISVLSMRGGITGPQDPKLAQMRDMSARGIQALQTAPKPEGMADADWAKRKALFGTVFEGGLGFAALQAKDYPAAQQHLRRAVEAQPENFADVYPLALAYLEARPVLAEGLFWGARAAHLAPAQAKQQIANYAQSRYRRFHGDAEGWDQVMAAAASNPTPPAGFSVTPAPTAAELAEKWMATIPIDKLSPDQIEIILASGNQAAAQKLWAGFKGRPQQFRGRIIEVPSKTQLMVAFSAQAIEDNRASVDLTMSGAIPASMMPKPGEDIALQGTPVSYEVMPAQNTNPPTVVIKMDAGALLTAKKPAKPAPRRRR